MKPSKHIFLVAVLCLCGAFSAKAAYNGTPAIPRLITSENYSTYGFTSENYSAYEGWYAISSAEELYGFAALVNDGTIDANGVLTADIVVNENVLTSDGELNGIPTHIWTPIGTTTNSFVGNFDGQEHTISGLYFNKVGTNGVRVGLFGCVKGTGSEQMVISNVGIVDSYIRGEEGVGGICGGCGNCFLSIINCYNKGTIITDYTRAGGIIGKTEYEIKISHCYNAGKIIGNNSIGGIVGETISNTSITNCHNVGTISGDNFAGGIVGRTNSNITNCYNEGNISGVQYVGGISASGGIITNCYNIGSVSGTSRVGGICVNGYGGYITNCYNTGIVKGVNDVFCLGNDDSGTTYGDIVNSYYLIGSKRYLVNGEEIVHRGGCSSEEFTSGRIAYLLNGSVSGGTVWYQNLSGEKDASPVLDSNHGVVYAPQPCKRYANQPEQQHNWNDKGICTQCYTGRDVPPLVDGYYMIGSASNLYWFAHEENTADHQSLNNPRGKLTTDIVVNTNVINTNGELNGDGSNFIPWIPIGISQGTYTRTLTVSFDGQGHTISGLYCDTDIRGVGLFGSVCGSISNVGIIDSYFSGANSVGSICGEGFPNITIDNCYSTATTNGIQYVGGICGMWMGLSSVDLVIKNCYNIGTVKGNISVGGICGYRSPSVNCFYLSGCAKDGHNMVQNGFGIDIDGRTEPDMDGKTTSATVDEFASGKIAYLLNTGQNSVWRQDLYADGNPLLNVTHNAATGYIEENDNEYTVVGDALIATNYVIAEGKTLVVPAGTSITTTGDAVITNNGTIKLGGTMAGNNLAGSGNFVYTILSENDVETASNGYVYKGTEYTLENGLSGIVKSRTICDKQFSFEVTGYTVSYENNLNVGNNAKIKWEGNSTVEKTFAITPNTNVTVTITGNNSTVTYNTEEQIVGGYVVEIEDATGIYTENDIAISGTATASGTTVGTYDMGLSAEMFGNTNVNFAEVQFVVTDGVLTINKAENAPSMPSAIETYYINTERVALPENWQWAESKALVLGKNTATANYVGTDADNYENVSANVIITRIACPHSEGYTTVNSVEPTCTQNGYTGDHQCGICNEIFEQGENVEATGHTYSNTITAPTCTTVGYTTHTCSVCEHTYNSDTIAAKGHKADSVEFENIVPATCTVAGSKDSVVFCSVCQVEVSREEHTIPATGHTEVTDAAVAATCTAAGKTEGKHCSVCNAVLVAQQEVDALGHKFEKYTYNNDATTAADGTETAVCEHGCGTTDTRVAEGTKLAETPEKGTAVTDAAASTLSIYTQGLTIIVENATEEISVYDAMGQLICRDAINRVRAENRTEISVTIPGLYIVKVGVAAKRVMVN